MRARIDCKKGGGKLDSLLRVVKQIQLDTKIWKFIKKLDVIRERSFHEECVEFCALDLGCVADYIQMWNYFCLYGTISALIYYILVCCPESAKSHGRNRVSIISKTMPIHIWGGANVPKHVRVFWYRDYVHSSSVHRQCWVAARCYILLFSQCNIINWKQTA